MKLLYPIRGTASISQKYGNKFDFYSDFHRGVDFRTWQYTDTKDREVIAAHIGEVVSVDTKSTGNTYTGKGVQGSSYGVHCILRFKDGGYTYYTLYGHMSRCDVKVGQKIAAGQVLGVAGNSGLSTREHLHFELRKGSNARSKAIDPTSMFSEKVPDQVPEWGKESWEWAHKHDIASDKSTFAQDGRLMVFLNRLAERIMGWVNDGDAKLEKRIEKLEADIDKLNSK